MKKLNTKTLTICAMLVALAIILSYTKVVVTSFIEIRFKFIPISLAGYLFGGYIGGIVGGLADVFGYLVAPTGPFHFGFTLSTILSGVIYGLFLHKNASLKNIIIATVLNALLINLALNTLWLSQLYGKGFIPVLAARMVKEVIMIPVNIFILTFSIRILQNIPTLKKLIAQ